MALLSQFKLGRAGKEATFEINPTQFNPTETRISDQFRGADGSMNDITVARMRGPIRIPGNYISPTFWNQLRSLSFIDDAMLVFEPFGNSGELNLEVWQEKTYPSSLTNLTLRRNSFTLADQMRAAVSGSPVISLVSITSAIGTNGGRIGTGTEYISRATIARATSIITFSPALPNLNPVFVTYRSTAYAVYLDMVPSEFTGGQVDTTRYDIVLVSA